LLKPFILIRLYLHPWDIFLRSRNPNAVNAKYTYHVPKRLRAMDDTAED
jgi:hypothetical protein